MYSQSGLRPDDGGLVDVKVLDVGIGIETAWSEALSGAHAKHATATTGALSQLRLARYDKARVALPAL